MSSWKFALKRVAASRLFMLYLLLIVLAVFAASFYGSFAGLPAAGIYNAGSGAVSQKIVASLEERGFTEYASESEMQLDLQKGLIDCAAVLPADFDARLQKGETEGIISFFSAPSSFAPMIYKSHLSAVLFSEYAPYITAAALAEYDIPREEVLQEYEAMLADGYAFSFEILSADGKAPENLKSHNLVIGAAAIFVFIAVCIFSVPLLQEAFGVLALRIGSRKMLMNVILPGLAVRSFLAALAAAAGMVAAAVVQADAFYFRLVPAVFVYCLLLISVSLLLAAVMPKERYQNVLLTLLVLISLALCPLFVDISLLSPLLNVLRFLLPCYWLWLLPQNVLLSLAALMALPLTSLLFLFCCKSSRKLI